MPPLTSKSRSSAKPIQSDHGRANTLGLGKADLDAILDHLDAEGASSQSHRRESSRLGFRVNGLPLEIMQPGGGQTKIFVAARNLSRSGMSFLHSSYMHPGTSVIAILPHRTLGPQRIEGTLVRCRHVTRHIHDCGVRFKSPINMRDYLDMDTFSQAFSCEKVDAASLKGTLLVVAEYKIEGSCIQSMLRDTGLEVIIATNLDDGFDYATKGADLIICDYAFEKGNGIEYIARARAAGVRCPILIMSADTSTEACSAIRAGNATSMIAKPIQQATLLRAIAEFMLNSDGGEIEGHSLTTTLPADSPMLGLADSFVDDLKTCAAEVEKLGEAKDVDAIRRYVLRISGAAPALGFDPVAKLGQNLLKALAATMAVEESLVQLNTFIATCRATSKRAAAPDPSKAQFQAPEAIGADGAAATASDAPPADAHGHAHADAHAGDGHDDHAPKPGH